MADYLNTEPIDDPMVVLDLMVEEWNDRTHRRLQRWPHAPPHVQIDHYGSGYGRHCGTDRYLVTASAIERLLVDGLIKGTPQWGYTEMRELVSTDRGADHLYERRRELGDFPRATHWFRRGAVITRRAVLTGGGAP